MSASTSPIASAIEPAGQGVSSGGRLGRLTGRQVNLLLEALVILALSSGVASWLATDRWSGWFAAVHAVAGLALLLVVPTKVRGPVRTGMRRARWTRWVSAAFGVLVLAAVATGIAHATGLWFGVGYWSALWSHQLFGFLVAPLLVWHVVSRPVRPKVADVDRRAVLRTGLVAGGAAAAYLAQNSVSSLVGLGGADRRSTGSYEVASFDPANMPRVSWFNDTRPADTAPARWRLTIESEDVGIDELWNRARPTTAILDCTGGWFSEQRWDAVPLRELVSGPTGRSVRVVSATGYDRYFGHDELDDIHLAVGYGGEPLRPGHGAPVRLIVPGRRGPWWVKWVVTVESADRPAWAQPPLPLA